MKTKMGFQIFIPSTIKQNLFPAPQISEGFRATTNNYEQNIVQSIGTFTTKQFFTEKIENRAENV